MTDRQIQLVLADPDKYLDGTLRIEACISYDRDTGMGEQQDLDFSDFYDTHFDSLCGDKEDEPPLDPADVPPYDGVWWGGDGWYEGGTLININGPDKHGYYDMDIHLDGGGQAGGYPSGDVEIIDERFPELCEEVPIEV